MRDARLKRLAKRPRQYQLPEVSVLIRKAIEGRGFCSAEENGTLVWEALAPEAALFQGLKAFHLCAPQRRG